MEPAAATSFPVARDAPPRPAPQTAQLGTGPARRKWWRWALLAFVLLLLAASFAWNVYQARHRPRNLAFIVVTYYLIALLYCCLAKLDLLRRDDPAKAPERWRVKMGVWWVTVALVNVIAARVADAMPHGGLRIAVWVIASVGIGVGFYFFFVRAAAGRRMDDRAVQLHEVSPEQRPHIFNQTSTYKVHRSKKTMNTHTRRKIQSLLRDPQLRRRRRRRPASNLPLPGQFFRPLRDASLPARRAATSFLSMNTPADAPPAPLPCFASAATGFDAGGSWRHRAALGKNHLSSAAAPQQLEKEAAHGRSADPRARQGRRPREGAPPELHHRRGRTPPPKRHRPHHRLHSAAGSNPHTPTL